jgi:NAD(P)H-hydrate epimerase
MNQRALSRDEVRQVDRRAIAEFGMSGLVLMENAGRGCVDVLMQIGCRGPVTVCCGKGNNGGDGLVIARHLDLRGIAAKVLLLCDPMDLQGDARANWAILRNSDVPIVSFAGEFDSAKFEQELADAEWIVDALLGTGATGEPRPPYDAAIRAMNAASARKLAIDLPSGLDCDTGIPAAACFRADDTCTLVAAKLGFENVAARAVVGNVHVLDVGAPRCLIESVLGSL